MKRSIGECETGNDVTKRPSLPQEKTELGNEEESSLVSLLSKDLGVTKPPTVRIYVDGYYGNDSFLTNANMLKMCDAVRKVVEEWGIDFSRVHWVSVMGAWAKAVPVYMMELGLGKKIHFHAPTPNVDSTMEGMYIKGKSGLLLTRSLELMDLRIYEGKRASSSNQTPMLTTMRQLINSKRGFIRDHEDWSDQRRGAARDCDYMIFLPYYEPGKVMTQREEDDYKWKYGGVNFDTHNPKKKKMVNLYTLFQGGNGFVKTE